MSEHLVLAGSTTILLVYFGCIRKNRRTAVNSVEKLQYSLPVARRGVLARGERRYCRDKVDKVLLLQTS